MAPRSSSEGHSSSIATLYHRSGIRGAAADVRATNLASPHPLLSTLLPSLERTYALVQIAAPAKVPVTVFGETGTGKEVVARAVHTLSKRVGRSSRSIVPRSRRTSSSQSSLVTGRARSPGPSTNT